MRHSTPSRMPARGHTIPESARKSTSSTCRGRCRRSPRSAATECQSACSPPLRPTWKCCEPPTTTRPSSHRSSILAIGSGTFISPSTSPSRTIGAATSSEILCANSLHTVWDTCIIEKKLGTDPQTIAQDLLDGLPDSDRAAWVAVPIAGWANESFQVTRRKSGQYCFQVGSKCFYKQGNETFSEGEEEKATTPSGREPISSLLNGASCSTNQG